MEKASERFAEVHSLTSGFPRPRLDYNLHSPR
jgi:hypothetical protein